MVRYIKSVVDQAGGTEKFAQHCRDHDVKLNLGSPPFICLLPVRQPSPTKFNEGRKGNMSLVKMSLRIQYKSKSAIIHSKKKISILCLNLKENINIS